jgi:hypothetical protein
MKKAGCVFLLIVLAGPAVSAQISVRVKTGMNYISPTDYNEAVEGRSAYIASYVVPPMQGSLSPFHLGWNFNGEAVWSFMKDFSLGFGVGYTRFATDDQLIYQYPTTSPTYLFGGTWNVKTSVAVLPLVLKVHYTLPLTKTIMLTAGLGPGIYFCSFNYTLDFVGGYMGASDQNWTETLAAHKTTFGFEGEVGLEIPLAKKIFAEVNVGGRLAKLSEFTGDYSTVGKDEFGPWDYKSNKGYLFFYDYAPHGKTYREYGITDSPNPSFTNFQRGTINLSGVFVSAGVRVAL